MKDDGKVSSAQLDSSKLESALREAEEHCNPTVVAGNWEALELDLATDTQASTNGDSENGTGSTQTHTVYTLRIPRSIELHALADGRVLIRSGAKNRPLGGQEILRLASTKTTGDFEAETLPGLTKDDFSKKIVEEYLEKRTERTKRPFNGDLDELYQEIGAVDSDGKPTVSGALLFAEYPQQWIPQCSVVFAKFVGKSPRGESGLAGYTRREELTGPLPRLIEAAWNSDLERDGR